MFAIVAAAVSMLFTSVLVRHVSRLAAVAIGLAGVGFVVAAFTRLECPDGAAGCGLGGRFEVSGSTEIGHWTATTVSTILLVAGIGLSGIALIRRGHRIAGVASLAAAGVTAGAFLATGGENPGVMQRVGIVVGTGWLAAFALGALVSRGVDLTTATASRRLSQQPRPSPSGSRWCGSLPPTSLTGSGMPMSTRSPQSRSGGGGGMQTS